jgi:hypothetical protein
MVRRSQRTAAGQLWAIVLVMIGLTLSVGATQASAKTALLAVDNATPTLKQDGDGSWSGTLGLTNLTDGALSLSATPAKASDSDCKLRLSKAAIGAAQSAEVTLTVPKDCNTDEETVEVILTASGTTTQTVPLIAGVPEGDDGPDWGQLAWFFYPLPIVGLVLYGLFVSKRARRFGRKDSRRYRLCEPLEHLGTTYSFKDSWISNLTVVAGVLTGLFGSADVVKAFLGEDADRSIALATVGSAIALILIGSGPVILTATKKTEEKVGEGLVQAFTVGGLLLATTVTVAGAFGQLWVGWKSGQALDLGGWENRIVFGFLAAVGLLVWYTLATVGQTLRAGTTPPPPARPTELMQLVTEFRKAMEKHEDVPRSAIPTVIEEVLAYPTFGTSPGDDPSELELVMEFRKAMERHEDVPYSVIPAVVEEALSYPTIGTSRGDEPYAGLRRRAAMP